MKINFKCIVLFCLSVFQFSKTFCQDIRSGEITTLALGGKKIEITFVLYTQISTSLNRPYITIDCGDGAVDTVATNTPYILNQVYKYIYRLQHEYSHYGIYHVSVNEGRYIANISNILMELKFYPVKLTREKMLSIFL